MPTVTVDPNIAEMTVAVFPMSALSRIGSELKRSSVRLLGSRKGKGVLAVLLTFRNEIAIQRHLEYAERTLRWHEVILGWIEQQRLARDLRPPTPVEEDSDNQNAAPKAVRRASTRHRRSRRPDTSVVLGNVRISKPTPKSRDMQIQTFKASKSKPIIVDSDVTTPSSIQPVPKRRERKSRRAPETSLGQLRPQGVSKAK